MPVDPQAQVILDELNSTNMPPLHMIPLDVLRTAMDSMENEGNEVREPVERVEDRTIPGQGSEIPVRIYTPKGTGPFPVLVYFHGGGFVLGSIEGHDAVCRVLTNATPCITISVEYRLAPEHPYPAAPEDCYAATSWAAEHAASLNGDPARIAVGGDSAGGNLATVVALMAKERRGPRLIYQVLIYPVTDNHQPGTASLEQNAEGYFLTKDAIFFFDTNYLSPDVDRKDPYAFPLYAKDLHGLPPALVITAEYDPLRDEGDMYAQRLREAGVPTTLKHYEGMIHGFVSFSHRLDKGKAALAEIAASLRQAFA